MFKFVSNDSQQPPSYLSECCQFQQSALDKDNTNVSSYASLINTPDPSYPLLTPSFDANTPTSISTISSEETLIYNQLTTVVDSGNRSEYAGILLDYTTISPFGMADDASNVTALGLQQFSKEFVNQWHNSYEDMQSVIEPRQTNVTNQPRLVAAPRLSVPTATDQPQPSDSEQVNQKPLEKDVNIINVFNDEINVLLSAAWKAPKPKKVIRIFRNQTSINISLVANCSTW